MTKIIILDYIPISESYRCEANRNVTICVHMVWDGINTIHFIWQKK
jgi:hypothetical protein